MLLLIASLISYSNAFSSFIPINNIKIHSSQPFIIARPEQNPSLLRYFDTTELKSTIVDVDYDYEDEDDDIENELLSKNQNKTTKFNEVILPSGVSIAEIEPFDLPTRYIIPMLDEEKKYVMIDVPPYSKELQASIESFCSCENNSTNLVAILITNQNSVHYQTTSLTAYYSPRVSDLQLWKEAFPNINVVMHRIDIARDMKPYVSQVIDGYGPFAYDDHKDTFVETGKPVTIIEWDDDLLQSFVEEETSEEEQQQIEKTRILNEQNKSIIAMLTPGHTSGSICYIFPKLQLCCSGFSIPIESTNTESSTGMRLDYKGYITTNKAGLKRQADSVEEMIQMYGHNISIVLPSRGGIYYLPEEGDDSTDHNESRMGSLRELMERFRKVGEIYESLGI